ncbi:MAG: Zinc phosphodiesterase ELAC protein 2 [Vezdaea aestivalis]|nr:MAG: Zinc phosphodiesterase ELAC protein 2 [Vezdaea aestivalis]
MSLSSPTRSYATKSPEPKARPTMRDLRIVSTPTADTPGTVVVLALGKHKYIFGNAAAGLQRLLIERGEKLTTLTDFFITGRMDCSNTEGLLGMLISHSDLVRASDANMSLKASTKPNRTQQSKTDANPRILNLHGGPNLSFILTKADYFFQRGRIAFREMSHRSTGREPRNASNPDWEDGLIKVWKMGISPRKRRSSSGNSRGPEQRIDNDEQRKRTFDEMSQSSRSSPQEDDLVLNLGNNLSSEPLPENVTTNIHVRAPQSSDVSMSYFVSTKERRGKFLVSKADELKVPDGQVRGRLTQGESITLPDGRVIRPEDVLAPNDPPQVLAFIDLPTTEHVSGLVSRPEWSFKETTANLGLIIWILGPSVIHSTVLRAFIDGLPNVQHIVSSEDTCANYLAFEKSATACIRFAKLDSNHTLIPIHNNTCSVGDVTNHATIGMTSGTPPLPWRAAKRGLAAFVVPSIQVDDTHCVPYLNTNAIMNERGPKSQMPLHGSETGKQAPDFPEAEVLCLGTGSAAPSSYRNVAATLLKVPDQGYYLFDCGEGTLGQLRRAFNPQELLQVFANLRMIFISHQHADHFLGLLDVLKFWNKSQPSNSDGGSAAKRLRVIAEGPLLWWIVAHSSFQPLSLTKIDLLQCFTSRNYIFDPLGHTIFSTPTRDHSVKGSPMEHNEILNSMGIKTFAVASTFHCPNAKCVSITFKDGFKFSYSGDTRPSMDFAAIGKGSNVLVHEATLDDEMQEDAIKKKHSTVSEAVGVGLVMEAKNLILTHISSRYSKFSATEIGKLQKFQMESLVRPAPLTPEASDVPYPKAVHRPYLVDQPLSHLQQNFKDMNIIYARDFTKVKVRDMEALASIMPGIQRLYIEHESSLAENQGAKKENDMRRIKDKNRSLWSEKQSNMDQDREPLQDGLHEPSQAMAAGKGCSPAAKFRLSDRDLYIFDRYLLPTSLGHINLHPSTPFGFLLFNMAPAAGAKKQKKKWSKGKSKDNANHAVVFDKATSDKLYKEVPSYRLITVAMLVDRMKINGSLARKALADLEEKGQIKKVVAHSKLSIYTRATAAAE